MFLPGLPFLVNLYSVSCCCDIRACARPLTVAKCGTPASMASTSRRKARLPQHCSESAAWCLAIEAPVAIAFRVTFVPIYLPGVRGLARSVED